MSTVIQMKDVLWGLKVARIATRDGRCAVCRKPYTAFVSFRIAIPNSLLRPMKFANLPCGCIDPVEDSEVASDVLARLILVAEDANIL